MFCAGCTSRDYFGLSLFTRNFLTSLRNVLIEHLDMHCWYRIIISIQINCLSEILKKAKALNKRISHFDNINSYSLSKYTILHLL